MRRGVHLGPPDSQPPGTFSRPAGASRGASACLAAFACIGATCRSVCGGRGQHSQRRLVRSLPAAAEPASREGFQEVCVQPWTPGRRAFEATLARLSHPRVRDLAWAALHPALCASSGRHGGEVLTDGRIRQVLGDVAPRLEELDQDPAELEEWLGSHGRAATRFVGLYYESLVHFAFERLGRAPVALYSEQVPRDVPPPVSAAPAAPLVVRYRKPQVRSWLGKSFSCQILRLVRTGKTVRVEFRAHRAESDQPVPCPSSATLRADAQLWMPSECHPIEAAGDDAVGDGRAIDGHICFEGVTPSVPVAFCYGPGFSEVELRQPAPPQKPVAGEVDYVLWPPPGEPGFLHVEVAVKFYLATSDGVGTWDDFIAPNPIDILGVKLRRMLNHQLKMGQTDHIRSLLAEKLAARGDAGRVQVDSALYMNGILFRHATSRLDALLGEGEAWHERVKMLSEDLEVGWWCRFGELPSVLPEGLLYAELQKPYWLAPLRGAGASHGDHGALLERDELLADARGWKKFRFVAALRRTTSGAFEELCRGFVVPDSWPEVSKRDRRRAKRDWDKAAAPTGTAAATPGSSESG